MKVCNCCKLEKDESEFGIDNSIKSGISGRCRKCKAKSRRNSPRHRNKLSLCMDCGIEFSHSYNSKGEYCKLCIGRATSRKHYEKYLLDNSIAFGYSNMGSFKKHFLEEQNHLCDICKMPDT